MVNILLFVNILYMEIIYEQKSENKHIEIKNIMVTMKNKFKDIVQSLSNFNFFKKFRLNESNNMVENVIKNV